MKFNAGNLLKMFIAFALAAGICHDSHYYNTSYSCVAICAVLGFNMWVRVLLASNGWD